jgi:hypothetical protein
MRLFLSVIGVVLFASVVLVWSQGGYLNPSSTGAWQRWNLEQSTNAMSTPYTMITADSTACGSVSTKYGSHHRLIRFANYSGSTQYIKVVSNNTGDTSFVVIAALSVSEKTSCIRKVISGMVKDSTRLDFIYE